MPYYTAKRKRTYIESVRVYARTKKEANSLMEEDSGRVLETSTESTVSVIPKTTSFDTDAEERCRELFEVEQKEKANHNDS